MKLFFKVIANLGVYLLDIFESIFSSTVSFFKRVGKSVSMMSKAEKIFAVLFLICAIVLSGIKVEKEYTSRTNVAPADGGIYKEVVYGDFKYLNPLLASTDAEKASSKLVFSGLVKYDKDNNVLPDLADSWEISPDGLRYTFTLKENVLFHDGTKFSSEDVVYTVDKIKNPTFESPLSDAWANVNVTADGNKVIFDLPRPYGPFIYSCDFGVLPSHMPDDQFDKKLTGTGPYKFTSSTTKNSKITKVNLEKNAEYFNGAPYISNIELNFFDNQEQAQLAFKDKAYNAISGIVPNDKAGLTDLSFATTKRLGLIFNLRNEKLKDKALRQKILSNEDVEGGKLDLTLSTLDNNLQRSKAEELKNQFAPRNINLTVKYYNSVAMQEVLANKDYELLLFGFDFGHDRDPYMFWHSSQMDRLNFAGFSDKNSDILLEDARMITDSTARNAKYDQFFTTIQSEALAAFYDPIQFNFFVKSDIKDARINGNEVEYRYDGIEKWYIKTKRVKK